MERANFLFQGPNSKKGNPVFYIIASRLSVGWLIHSADQLIEFVRKKMAGVADQGMMRACEE